MLDKVYKWVASAVNQNERREFLRYVYVDRGYMIGTDAYSLHLARTNLESGFYNPRTGQKVDFTYNEYPDWFAKIPTTGEFLNRPHIEVTKINKQYLKYDEQSETHFEKSRVDLACSDVPPLTWVWPKKISKPLRIDFLDGRIALIQGVLK